jgi:hypothetical protein
MARGDSLDAPIALEDDINDRPRYIPTNVSVPSVRWENTQSLDQDDIEEVEHQTAWEQAVAQRARVKQRRTTPKTLNNSPNLHQQNEQSSLMEPPLGRPPSVKSITIIDLLTDEDEPIRPRVTQQCTGAGTNQLPLDVWQLSAQRFGNFSNNDIRQEAPPIPGRTSNAQAAGHRTAILSPIYRSPYPLPPLTPRPLEPVHKVLEATQPSAFSSHQSLARPVSAVPINSILNEDISLHRSTQDTQTPLPSHKPAELAASDTIPSFLQPIGDLADHQRERTTCRRVNTTSERATAAAHTNKRVPLFPMAAKACMPGGSIVAVVQPKQKAIKSVRQKNYVPIRVSPQQSTSNYNSPYTSQDEVHTQSNNAPSPTTGPGSFQKNLAQTSATTNLGVSLTERPKDPYTKLDRLPSELQGGAESIFHRNPDNRGHHAHNSTIPSVHSPIAPLVEPDQNLEAPPPASGVTTDSTPNTTSVEERLHETTTFGNGVAAYVDKPKPALAIHAHDLATTRSAIDECLKRHIAERHEAHAKLTWIKMRHQRTYQEKDLRARRKQKCPAQSSLPERFIQHTSPFARMPVIQMPFDRNCTSKGLPDVGQEIFIKGKPKYTVVRSALLAPTSKFRSDSVIIPPFKEYVSLRNNVLADNESKLLATPYFEDEDYESRQALLGALPSIYELTHDEKGPLDLRKEQCRFYKTPIEAFLVEIGVTWNDVLYWLLASDDAIKQINATFSGSENFSMAMLDRSRYSIEEFERDEELKQTTLFDRGDEKWKEFVSQLEKPSATNLRLAATACAAVLQECEFSIWYLAQQSSVVQNNVWRKTASGEKPVQSLYRQIWCRVCHQ